MERFGHHSAGESDGESDQALEPRASPYSPTSPAVSLPNREGTYLYRPSWNVIRVELDRVRPIAQPPGPMATRGLRRLQIWLAPLATSESGIDR